MSEQTNIMVNQVREEIWTKGGNPYNTRQSWVWPGKLKIEVKANRSYNADVIGMRCLDAGRGQIVKLQIQIRDGWVKHCLKYAK